MVENLWLHINLVKQTRQAILFSLSRCISGNPERRTHWPTVIHLVSGQVRMKNKRFIQADFEIKLGNPFITVAIA